MLSYAYPVRESSNKHSVIKFYYCAEQKTGKGKKQEDATKWVHGTVLNTKKEVVLTPNFYVTYNNLSGPDIKKFRISDCTVVNFSYMDGSWKMGTRNSWNISETEEFHGLTNKHLFDEVLEKKEYSFDFASLDRTKIHTFAFSNPKCHFLSDEYSIWAYDPNYEFVDLPEELDETKKPANEKESNYVALDPATGELGVNQSSLWQQVTNVMYTGRMSVIDQDWDYDVAVAKLLLKALIHRHNVSIETIYEFMEANLNQYCKKIFEVIKQTIKDIDEHFLKTVKMFDGFRLPDVCLGNLVDFSSIMDENQNAQTKNFLIKVISKRLKKAE